MAPHAAVQSPTVSETYDVAAIRKMAKAIGSDGCTGVSDIYLDCCYHHDIMWRTGHDINGKRRSTADANRIFRDCIQERSIAGKFSPVSWVRWVGVTVFGWIKRPKPTALPAVPA